MNGESQDNAHIEHGMKKGEARALKKPEG